MSAPHPHDSKHKRSRKPRWQRADNLVGFTSSASENEDTETSADESFTHTGSASTQQPLRGMNMNAYPSQPGARQTPRLQNTQKPAVGNGGWGNFGGMGGGGGGFGGGQGFAGQQQQGRPSQLSGFAQVMGGGGQQGPIDMSDFPSLSGGPRPAQNNTTAASWNSNAIRQPSQPAQQPPTQPRAPSAAPSQQSVDQFETQQRAQVQPSERQQSGDDFPPLGGQGGQVDGDVLTQTPSGFTSSLGSPDMQHPRTNGQPMRDASASFPQAQQPPIGPPPPQQQQAPAQPPQAPTPPTSNVKRYADMTEAEKWGMGGLMAAFEARRVIEAGGKADDSLPPAMINGIMMGQDLDQLGMDLNSDTPLYPTFTPFPAVNMSGSSYDYHDRHVVPDFHLPSGYTVNNVPPLPGRMSAFSDETLFSVFYQHPRDIIQEFAAHELVGRDWRWHKVVRQWLQKDTKESNANSSLPLVDLTQGAPIGMPPMRISERSERGVYVFFDARNWRRERREFLLDYEQLENKVIPGMTPGMGLLGGPVGGAGGVMSGGQGGLGQGGQGSSQVPGA